MSSNFPGPGLGVQEGQVIVDWNPRFEEWDITSGPPNFITTTAQSRQAAINKARRMKNDDQTILIKGPRMSQFKKL